MKRRMLSLIFGAVAAASLLTACGSNSTKNQPSQTEKTVTEAGSEQASDGSEASEPSNLTIPVASSVSSLNRLLEGYKEGWMMLAPVYDELYYKDVNETRYYLADSYEVSGDGLSVTLKLKEGMTWHDGEPITADDIIFSLDCNMDTNNGANFTNIAYINEKPVSYEKTDDLTVVITLPEPSASYPDLLGKLTPIPKHIYNGNTSIADAPENMKGIGSGPYKVVEFKQDQYLVLERYDNYYGGKAAIDTVTFKIISTDTQEVALMKGDVNFMELSTAEAVAKYASDSAYSVITYPEGRVNYMAVNKFSSTFDDPKVIEAVFAALDREQIIQGAYGQGMAEPANSIFSNVNLFYDSTVKSYERDLEKAKQLVEETGLGDKTLKLYFNADRVYMKETALIIQQQMKEAGINLEVTPIESSGFFTKVFGEDGDYEFYLNGYGASGDPDIVVAGMYDGTWGVNLKVSDEAAALWKDGRGTSDDKERKEIYKKLQEQAMTDMSVYPIAYPNYVFVVSANLKGADTLKTTPVFEDYMKLKFE